MCKHTHTQVNSCVARVLYNIFSKKEIRDENLDLSGFTAICSKQLALGNHSNLALGSKLQAISNKLIAECYSKLITSHSSLALGSKQKATSHSSLITHHFYPAESLKLKAYGLNTALPLAFLALGCSPVLVSYILCVVFLGAGRFLCTDVRCNGVPVYQCTSVHQYIIPPYFGTLVHQYISTFYNHTTTIKNHINYAY